MRELLYTDAVSEAIREEMRRDDKVFVMGEDVGLHGNVFGCCKGLYKVFGEERVRNTPISEAAIIGCGMGAAITGMRPIVELMFVDFAPAAMDQIVNQVAKIRYMLGGKVKVPMVIRTQQGGYVQNAAQHSQSLEAFFVHTPGLKVVMPSTPYDAMGLLKSAIRDDNPVVVLEHKGLYHLKQELPDEEFTVPIGIADVKRAGKDVTIIATSKLVHMALKAAERLKEKVSVEVIDPRTVMPLDKETIINSIKKTRKVVIAHEAHKICGVGAEIAAMLAEEAFEYLDAPIERIGAKHVAIPYSVTLENACLPQIKDIIEAVDRIIKY